MPGRAGAAPLGADAVVVARRLTVEDVLGRPAGAVTIEEEPRALEVARALGVPVVRADGAVLSAGQSVLVDGDAGEVRALPA